MATKRQTVVLRMGSQRQKKNNNQAIEEAEELEDEVVISGICDEVQSKEEPKETPGRETNNEGVLGEWQEDNQEPSDSLGSNQDEDTDEEKEADKDEELMINQSA